MTNKIKKPYFITEDGVSHYDEFLTTLSGQLTSIPSPLMPDRKPLVNSVYPEGRVYSVTLQEKGELGAEATVRFVTYEEARTFFKRVSLHCKTIREALACIKKPPVSTVDTGGFCLSKHFVNAF